MKFEVLPRVYPEMAMWGSDDGVWSYVISRDGGDPYMASVKKYGSRPGEGMRHDLGSFRTKGSAEAACEAWSRGHRYS